MRGRIGIAAVGLLALTAVCALSSGAGAQASQCNVEANGALCRSTS